MHGDRYAKILQGRRLDAPLNRNNYNLTWFVLDVRM